MPAGHLAWAEVGGGQTEAHGPCPHIAYVLGEVGVGGTLTWDVGQHGRECEMQGQAAPRAVPGGWGMSPPSVLPVGPRALVGHVSWG